MHERGAVMRLFLFVIVCSSCIPHILCVNLNLIISLTLFVYVAQWQQGGPTPTGVGNRGGPTPIGVSGPMRFLCGRIWGGPTP
jgi:hypothetical protein